MRATCFLLSALIAVEFSIAVGLTWTNWGNTQQCTPLEIFRPESLADLQGIILDAAHKGIRVKAVGSGHSWSDLVVCNGYLIETDALDKILAINYEKKQVTVQGGIKIRQLITQLAHYGLCLSNQGFIAEQSIAGAIATATHGTGNAYNLSDYVVSLEIMDGLGTVHTISATDNPAWLAFARVGLGALGIVYSVTLQCEPLFNLIHSRKLMDLATAIRSYQELYDAHDYYMFMVNPYNTHALVFLWDKTALPVNTRYNHYWLNDCVFNKFINCFALMAFKHIPAGVPFCIKTGLEQLQMEEHVEYSHISLSPIKTPLSVKWYIEEEIAIPFEMFESAFNDLLTIYERYKKRGIDLQSIITCRFGPGTNRSYLSPCYGRKTAYLTINIINYFPQYLEFFNEFEDAMLRYAGRPHWGKFHSLNSVKVKELYGKEIVDEFNKLRQILDPHSIFANDFINRCFN